MQKHQFLTKPISSHIHDLFVIFLNLSPGWWFQLLWIMWSTSIYSWSNWLRRTKWPTMMRHTDLPLPRASAGGTPRSLKLYVQRPQHAEWWTHHLSHMLQSQKHYMVSKWHTLLYRHDRFIKSSNKLTIEHLQKHQFLTKPISSHIHDSFVIFLN